MIEEIIVAVAWLVLALASVGAVAAGLLVLAFLLNTEIPK